MPVFKVETEVRYESMSFPEIPHRRCSPFCIFWLPITPPSELKGKHEPESPRWAWTLEFGSWQAVRDPKEFISFQKQQRHLRVFKRKIWENSVLWKIFSLWLFLLLWNGKYFCKVENFYTVNIQFPALLSSQLGTWLLYFLGFAYIIANFSYGTFFMFLESKMQSKFLDKYIL